MEKNKQMKGDMFVRNILSGERDLSYIDLEEGFDLSGYEGFEEMQNYLRNENLEKEPFYITGSSFRHVQAKGLYLPHVQGKQANFENANLWNANLGKANLENANLGGACLQNANLQNANLGGACLQNANLENTYLGGACLQNAYLQNANLWKADLGKADIRNANLWKADIRNANLWKADIRNANLGNANLRNTDLQNANLVGVHGLENSLNLEQANFYETKVTKKERQIIEKALTKNKLFNEV